jgi:hypothetical protein
MNAIPYAMMLCEPSPANSGAKAGSQSVKTDVGDSFSKCMSWVVDYDVEWTNFVQEHDMQKCWSHNDEVETDAPLRVWNFPHE